MSFDRLLQRYRYRCSAIHSNRPLSFTVIDRKFDFDCYEKLLKMKSTSCLLRFILSDDGLAIDITLRDSCDTILVELSLKYY